MCAWFTSCEEMPTVEDNVPIILDLEAEEAEAENCVVKSIVNCSGFSISQVTVFFQYSKTPDFENQEYLKAYSNNQHGFYYPIMGLEPGTQYFYRCLVQNNRNTEQMVISPTGTFTTDTRYRQTIIWSQDQTLYLDVNKEIKLTATSSSGLPVSYHVVEGGNFVKVSNSILYVISNGTAVIEATQDGNDMYYPASPVTKSFEIRDNKLIISDVNVNDWSNANGGSSDVQI